MLNEPCSSEMFILLLGSGVLSLPYYFANAFLRIFASVLMKDIAL